MPRLRRARVDTRYARDCQRNRRLHLEQQREPPPLQYMNGIPVDLPMPHVADLQLQQPEVGDIVPHEPDQPMHDRAEWQLENPHVNGVVPHFPVHPNLPVVHNLMEELPFELPAPHHLGDMTNRCPHCQARYFQDECTTQRVFTKCCFQGKVSLPPIQVPSQNMVQLFTGNTPQSQHFLQNIRHYNAALSMASWNATLREHAGRGPRVITIHGQTYHLTAAQEAPDGHPPQYAQLYILDTNEALQQRINDPHNTNLRPDIIQLLQDELLAVNPYARQYQTMGQILRRERETAAANNQPVQPVRMIIATRPFQDRRYATPTATEIAAVYVGHDGAAPNPSDRDLEVNMYITQ